MENKPLRVVAYAAAVAIGLAACDATPPPNTAVSQRVEPEAIAPGETLADVVRVALDDIVRDRDAYSRARRLGALLPTLGPEAVPAVKQMLADPTLSLDLGGTEIELLVRFWTSQQPGDAARWAVEQSPQAFRIAAIYGALTAWAEADPQAALIAAEPWSRNVRVGGAVQNALVRGWFAANDPPELRQYIHGLGAGMLQQRSLSAYVRSLIRAKGIDAAMRWAESIPDDDPAYKLAIFRQVTIGVARLDVEAARRWCEAHSDRPYAKDARGLVAAEWVKTDGAAALAWLSGAPEGLERDFAVRVVFVEWMTLDRKAAMAWLAAQTAAKPGPWLESKSWFDPTFPVYASALAQDSPAEAIAWVERVGGANREPLLIGVARVWRRNDEAAAEAWLVQSSLSAEAREKARVSGPGKW